MSLSTGIIVFQIINKNIIDALQSFRGSYSSDALKFAISALIISAPVYYIAAAQINKNLFKGLLDKDSGVRKWLTYFILLVSSVVMLGWLISTIYSFLDGELTVRFILKAATAIIIATIVFTYYLYDIKRENVIGVKDKIIKIYFYGSLVIVIAALVSAIVFVESPKETRNIKSDNNILKKFNRIDSAINEYYRAEKSLPDGAESLLNGKFYLSEDALRNGATKKKFDYKITGERTYELCADFLTSNKDRESDYRYRYYDGGRWKHDAGYQCLGQEVMAAAVIDIIEPKLMR